EAAAVVNGEKKGVYYGRFGNPTSQALEKKIAIMENGEAALAVSSGMAAISIAIMTFLKQSDHMIVTNDIYGGTHKFLSNIATRYGFSYDYVDCTSIDMIEENIQSNTRAIYLETPSNPTLTVTDIKTISKIAHNNNLVVIVDNTFMTPYLQRPLDLGADVVVHSATKYMNGYGDVIAGFVVGDQEVVNYMRDNVMGDLGQVMNAWESYLILRGLKTLGIRMERHCDNARKIANFLDTNDIVEKVHYPGFKSHPQYQLAKRQMKRMGGIVSFEIKGTAQDSKHFINQLELAMISFSLGDPETLVQHPASMTHSSIPEKDLSKFGISKGLIRLSAGLEDAEDI